MAAEALTDAQIVQSDGEILTVDSADATLSSKNEYGEAFSAVLNNLLGTPDPRVYGNQLTQKAMHVIGLVGFFFGNCMAVKAARMGKQIGALGILA
jgi:hypothetical protein